MLQIIPYNLPDFDIFNATESTFKIWIPDNTYIVLGAANNAEDSLNIENVISDNIPVMKRKSGGMAVVLSPKTIVIASLWYGQYLNQPKEIFYQTNSIIIQSLEKLRIKGLSQQGISDIAINEKKILGSSIYKSKDKIFYHAVLNYAENTKTFERYLKHPKREPEYRKGRNHNEFVTSIVECGYQCSLENVTVILNENLLQLFL